MSVRIPPDYMHQITELCLDFFKCLTLTLHGHDVVVKRNL